MGNLKRILILSLHFIILCISVHSRHIAKNQTQTFKAEKARGIILTLRPTTYRNHVKTKTDPRLQKTTERLQNIEKGLEVINRTIIHKMHSVHPTMNSSLTKSISKEDQDILQKFFVEKFSNFSKKSSTTNNTVFNSTSEKFKTKIENATDLQKFDCSKFLPQRNKTDSEASSFCYSPSDSLTCYQDPIFCKTFHMNGKRELDWPVYGEYSYLPHKHWVKILQHGGVVFLYHPCANESSVAKLRNLAKVCMLRYALTPYEKLTMDQPLAMVSWGCYLLMKDVNFSLCKTWIKSHAFKAPASHVHKNGKFETRLLKAADVVTDIKDTFLCPDEKEKASFHATIAPIEKPQPTIKKHAVEDLILKRLAKVKHIRKPHHRNASIIQETVNTKKAFSAFSSLVFLCVLMALLLLYTKLWRPSAQGKYHRLHEDVYQTSVQNDSWIDRVSLLKSSQEFLNSFQKKKERKIDSLSKMRLLAPINEESDEYTD